MKRTSMTTAIIAGIAGVAGISSMANAIYLNPDGVGSVLIYPYYTVNNGNGSPNATLVSVVNTTDEGKAVKVRFLEAYNSREVLDFNLYLSPRDVWVGEVVSTGAGASLFTNDNSCTVPPIPAGGAAFRTFAFDGTVGPKDTGPTGLSRTREGYIEMIEMGVVTNESSSSLDAITHDSTGKPSSCAQVVNAWGSNGYWTRDASTDITSPDGGLFGSASIINIAEGTIEGYNADAIDQFYLPNSGSQHTDPKSLSPSMLSATSLTSYVFENGQLATTTYAGANPVDAVSSLFMVDNIYNEYVVETDVGASTEWVVTFPTKRFYVDNYSNPTVVPSTGTAAVRPFDVKFGSSAGPAGTSCSPVVLQFWNREELTAGGSGTDFSPAPTAAGTALCYESQVVTFNQGTPPTTVLGSALEANIDVSSIGAQAGWARIDFVNLSGTTGAPIFGNHELNIAPTLAAAVVPSSGASNPSTGPGNVFYGLPATGFAVTEYVNGSTGGVLANYTGLYRHKFHRTCEVGATFTDAGACS